MNTTQEMLPLSTDDDDVMTTTSIFADVTTKDPNAVHMNRIIRSVPSVMFLIGTIGNFLSIAVFLRPKLRSSHTSFMFILLALSDTSVLWSAHLTNVSKVWFSVSIEMVSHTSCQVYMFLVRFCSTFAVWVLVVISIERFIFVYFPHKAKVILTRKKISTVFVAVFIMVFGFLALIIYASRRIVITENGKVVAITCTFRGENPISDFTDTYIPIANFIVGQAVPFCVMLACNAAIVVKLIIARKVRQETSNAAGDVSGVTAMLLGSSTLFMLLTFPSGLRFIAGIKSTTPSTYIFSLATQVLKNIHYSINFIIYCLTGTRFREELFAMFKCSRAKMELSIQTSVSTLEANSAV